MAELERLIAVDWSGDKGSGQRRKIWAGTWTRHPRGKVAGGRLLLEDGRSREELTEWLIGLADETPRMVVSIDCCFSYPAWFLAEHGCGNVFEFWRHVAAGHGERWLGTTCAEAERDVRFWGRPHRRPAIFSGEGYPSMMRRTDMENKIEQALEGGDPVRAALMKGIQPKSPFQIGGSGSVGTGSLRAMPWLLRLHESGFRVWPFEDAALGAGDVPPDGALGVADRMPRVEDEALEEEDAAFAIGDAARRSKSTGRGSEVAVRRLEDAARGVEDATRGGGAGRPLLVEMYTRLLTGPVKKSNAEARRIYLGSRRREDRELYGGLSRSVVEKAERSEDAFDALVCCLEMVRWQTEFAGLKATEDAVSLLEGITWRPGV